MGYFKRLFEELKRRNIYKVAAAYGITGWVIVQMAAIAAGAFGAPKWVMKMIITVVMLGFPIAVILAWAFEITPEGIKRTREVPKAKSIAPKTGNKLNYLIISLLSTALLFFIVENFWFDQGTSTLAHPTTEAGIPSVAVLPFEDFSPNDNKEWFSDGLTEEILNSLARLEGLKVAARTSSFYFKNKNIPIQQIADTLGVKHIIEGSVRLSDSTMRITVQLIQADSGFHLWSKTYDRQFNDVFDVQEDIAENIAAALNVYLDEEARENMFAFGTRNVLAYNAYLKGRNIYDEFHDNLDIDVTYLFTKANKWFEKAIKLDPDFAAPYYYHSDAYLHYLLNYSNFQLDTLSIDGAHNRIMNDFRMATEHAANPGQKLMYRLERAFLSDDWSQIPSLIQQLKNNPEAQQAYAMLAGGWTKSFLNIIGHAQLQYQLSQKALQRDPLNTLLNTSKIQALVSFASIDRMTTALNDIENRIHAPENLTPARYFSFLIHEKIEKASFLAQSIDDPAAHRYNIFLQAVRGNLKMATKNFEQSPRKEYAKSINSGILYYGIGNVDKANKLALSVDTLALGPQKLMYSIANFGGIMGFDVAAMPNLNQRFKEAGVEIASFKIGHITLPRIVQKEL